MGGKNEREGRAPITLDKISWLLGMACPMMGTLPISKITPQEVLAVLRKVGVTGRYESARRMRSVLSRVPLRYRDRADRDVAADLRGAFITPKVQHLAAITTPKEAGGLLRAIEGYTGHDHRDRASAVTASVRAAYGQEEMTAHGFRAMAATLLDEIGIWNPDAVEKQLAHLDTSLVRRAYTRGEY